MPCPTSTNTGFVIVIIPAACGCVEEGSKSQSTVTGSSLSRRAVRAAAALRRHGGEVTLLHRGSGLMAPLT
ncbi:hypothetical protein, partial [Klebsiella pneumoniae]|uniref:hypothetical protein n=1 Tax=Klebsiella pneumoniae TaxID=573 RepID=UPI0039183D13